MPGEALLQSAGRRGALRRHRRARRRVLRRRRGQHRRADRPQRRRQDHAVQLHLAASTTCDARRDRVRRRVAAAKCRATASPRSASAARSRTSRCSARMSVLDNVMVGAPLPHARRLSRQRTAPAARGAPTRRARDEGARAARAARPRARTPTRRSRDLPFGTQKRVELARALAARAEAAAARRAGERAQPRGGAARSATLIRGIRDRLGSRCCWSSTT